MSFFKESQQGHRAVLPLCLMETSLSPTFFVCFFLCCVYRVEKDLQTQVGFLPDWLVESTDFTAPN